MQHRYTIIMALAAAAMTGCATTQPAEKVHSLTFGQATAKNRAAQFVAPTAEQKANTFIPADRSRRNLAREKYKTNEVTEPVALTTRN